MTEDRRDRLWALAAGAVALTAYVRTLAPGLVAVIDVPMFQFVGRVLGVPHNPGYPLYVLVTHVFSHLPIGSLEYRINLFSACCGAMAVAATFLVSRRLGCGRIASAGAALGLAFGGVFWSQAVIAEVYTLHAALIAAMLLLALAWGASRRPRTFYAAVAVLALGLGNHTTILAFALGLAVYVVMTDRAFAMRPRTLATSGAIVAAGLLQYGFILLRSRQPGAYLESRANSLSELVGVVAAAQFQDRLFAYSWQVAVTDRLPLVTRLVLAPELTVLGLLLAVGGGAVLLWRRPPEGFLLGIGAVLVLAFALTYAVVDTPVFLIPTILVGWLWVALAISGIARRAGRLAPPFGVAVSLVALVLPGWLVARNFRASDMSRRTQEQVYLDRLFETTPRRVAFVREDFLVDRMVMSRILAGGERGGREFEVVAAAADQVRDARTRGLEVFAFDKAANRLRLEGLDFSYAWQPVTGQRLAEFVHDLPDGARVAIAAPATTASRFGDDLAAAATLLGGGRGLMGRTRSNFVLAGVRGARTGALERASAVPLVVDLASSAGAGFDRGAGIELVADGTGAAVRVGGREVVRASAGMVVATWSPQGTSQETFVLEAGGDGRLPAPRSPLSVYRLRGEWWSDEVAVGRWADASTATASGSVMARLGPGATITLCAGDAAALAPRVFDKSSGEIDTRVTTCNPDDLAPLPPARDRAATAGGPPPAAFRIDVSLPRTASRSASVVLALGGIPRFAVARASGGSRGMPATLHRVRTDDLLRAPDGATALLVMARDEQSMLVGPGWSAVETDRAGPFRWITGGQAGLLLPVSSPGPSRLALQALGPDDQPPTAAQLGLRLNGVELEPLHLLPGWNRYEWTPPAAAWRTGVNDLAIVLLSPATGPGSLPDRSVGVATVSVTHARLP